MSDLTPIQRAASAVGGQSSLARLLQCTPQAVQKWCTTGHIPAERVPAIEEATGIPREELRPDLFKRAA